MTRFQTTLATAALGLTTAIGGLFFIPEAKAAECVNGNGYRMCFEHVATNGQYNRWYVGVRNAHTDEVMDVTCVGKRVSDWESQGGFNQAEAEYLAQYFCSL